MNSCKSFCRQGRDKCVSPWACNTTITRNGGETVNTDLPITMEDEPASRLIQALVIAVVAFAVGIVVLLFLLGAV